MAAMRFLWPAWTRGRGDGVARHMSSLREEEWSRGKGGLQQHSTAFKRHGRRRNGAGGGGVFEAPCDGKRQGPRLDWWAAV
jgi:hypothetical protein